MGPPNQIKIQLLSVRDCPLTAKTRSTLNDCLEKIDADIAVEELVGDYHSPTLLVNGFDVTGEPPAAAGQTACRLDLPNEEQILAAIRGLSVLSCNDAEETDILVSAFQTLLHSGERIKVQDLSQEMDWKTDDLVARMKVLQCRGYIQLDEDGLVVGAGGLSLVPTKHELSIDGRRFWAWCAFDVIGIFGSLQASGLARSIDPSTNDSIVLSFVKGVPQDMYLKVFMANLPVGQSVCDGWCPNVNFFQSKSSAEAWIQASGVTGSLFSVGNLVPVAREAWYRYLVRRKH